MRWGPGPVFIYECLLNARRRQTYALRSAGVAALFSIMAMIALSHEATTASSWRDFAQLGEGYFTGLIGIELAIVLLAAPAATAGTICIDRARGTLAHMLMTDLSDAEIVLGKLAARLLPVLSLVACTWPVMAICSLLGGIDPIALTLAFAVIIAVAVLGCSIALVLSVWAKKSYEVILATYTVFILCMVIWPAWYMLALAGWTGPAPHWPLLANPFYVALAPYTVPGELTGWDYLGFFGVAFGAAILAALIALWRTRPVARRVSAETKTGPRVGWLGRIARLLPGPSLDHNPVLWREWHRTRPTWRMMLIVAVLMGTTFTICVGSAVAFWIYGLNSGPRLAWPLIGICSYWLHIVFGMLMLSALAPTSMAEERQRRSLDLLAVTALTTREIVIGKWLGTFRYVLPMTIGPGLMALAMATAPTNDSWANLANSPFGPFLLPSIERLFGVGAVIATILAHGALLTSIGLALAVWIKQHGRAIAMSVSAFILVTAAWPIFVMIAFNGEEHPGVDLACLSPAVSCALSIPYLMDRMPHETSLKLMPWLGTFWATEVFIAAMALLWLTVRTFDACFGRARDRTHRTSLTTAGVIIVAVMLGTGCVIEAFDYGIHGIEPGPNAPPFLDMLAISLALALGILLVGAEAVRSGRPTAADVYDPDAGSNTTAGRFILHRWWLAFRLALLLAIGPTFLALALCTVHRTPRYQPHYTKDAAGNQVVSSYELIAEAPYSGEVTFGSRQSAAAILIITILVHGGAAAAVGLSLATVNEWSRRTIAVAIVIAALAVIIAPAHTYALLLKQQRIADSMGWSFVVAVSSLLAVLFTRASFSVGETVLLTLAWDVAVALFTAGVFAWTIRYWNRRLVLEHSDNAVLAADLVQRSSTVAPTLIAK